jgi:hypothetical protein
VLKFANKVDTNFYMFLCFKEKLKRQKQDEENYFENLKEKEKLIVVQPPQA